MSNSDSRSEQCILFRLGEKKYGVKLGYLEEVIELQEIVHIPDMPPHIMGVTRYRTSVIPVVSIKGRLKQPEGGYDESSRIMVINYREENIGILIDQLVGITDGQDGNKDHVTLLNPDDILA